MAMPVILVTLGIASGIHILNKYLETLGQGMSKESAAAGDICHHNLLPC